MFDLCKAPQIQKKVMLQLKKFRLHLSDFKTLHAGLTTLDMSLGGHTQGWSGYHFLTTVSRTGYAWFFKAQCEEKNQGEKCWSPGWRLWVSPMSAFLLIKSACSERLKWVMCRHSRWNMHVVQNCSVTFTFMPSHEGVKGNERADSLASTAAMTDGRKIDWADILNIRDTGQTEDSEGEVDSTSLS